MEGMGRVVAVGGISAFFNELGFIMSAGARGLATSTEHND